MSSVQGMKRTSSLSGGILCLLAGHLLLGLAHVAMLPPWEGFDETAHYSYVQQLSDRWELPRLPTARMSKDIEDYARMAPLPYSSVPPFEHNGGLTYMAFFAGSHEAVARGKALLHDRPGETRRYAAGSSLNWEAQHPPLYYLALSPVYLATRHLSLAEHLFSLRLTSYLLAWSALTLAVYSVATAGPSALGGRTGAPQWAMLGIAVWPVLLPSWFPEMARLGNDSLSALILAGVWLVTVRAVSTELSVAYSLVLGVLLGAGCLTKAFFVPVTLGVLGFWSIRALQLRGTKALPPAMLRVAIVLLVVASVAGWWYIGNWRQYGVALGTMEMIELRNAGGLLSGLREKFSITAWARGHAAFITTLAWSGTWSLARPPYVYLAPMAFIVLVAAGAYAAALRRFPAHAVGWFPAWLGVPVVLGFSYHVLIRIGLTGEGRGTGGYYVHFLAAALGVALGLAIGTWWVSGVFRKSVAGLTMYAVVFGVAMSWAQVMLFSGWLFKSGAHKFYQAPVALPALFGLPDALTRLTVLAYPAVGVAAWVVGGLLVLIGLTCAWKASHALEHPVA